MHAFSKFKFAKRVFLLLSEKIGISYKVKKYMVSHEQMIMACRAPILSVYCFSYVSYSPTSTLSISMESSLSISS